MPKTARLNDINSAQGPIVNNVSPDVFINGKPAAFVTSIVAPHRPFKGPHRPPTTITSGSNSVLVNGKKLAHVGSNTSCKHVIATGSPDVIVGLAPMPSGGGSDPYNSPEARRMVQENGPAIIGLDQPPHTPEAPPTNPDKLECNKFTDNLTSEDYKRKISNSVTLGAVSSEALCGKHLIIAQHGLTVSQICCNLSALAENIIDPLRQQFPGLVVTSGFRQSKSVSDHEKGMAVDIQWLGKPKSELLQRCQWAVDNLRFWQIIFESPPDSQYGWMHIAYNNGKRHNSRPPILSWFGSNYIPGLRLTATG